LDYVTISTFEKPYIIVITFENDKPYIYYYYYRSQINTASTLWPAPHTLWQLPWLDCHILLLQEPNKYSLYFVASATYFMAIAMILHYMCHPSTLWPAPHTLWQLP
jgi:hypothetical protein